MSFFADPLTRRELSGTARRWQTFAARGVLGLVMACAVYYLWDHAGRSFRYGGTSAIASLAQEVFGLQFAGLMVLLPLMAATSSADLLSRELRNGTLGLLFLTPLTPWEIAAGKWKAAMAPALLFALAGAPVAAICVYLGGVGPWELLWGAVLPLATAGFAGAVALFFSTVFRSSAMTVIVSVVLLLLGTVGPLVWVESTRGAGVEFLICTHPAFAALAAALPGVMRFKAVAQHGWISAAGVAGVGVWILLRLAARRLPMRAQATPGPGLLSRIMAKMDAFFESINVGRVRFLGRSEEVWDSWGLLWKELRTRATGRLRHATRIGVALLLVLFVPAALFAPARGDAQIALLWIVAGLLLLQAVVTGISLFVHEKEGRQWEVLLSTPLTARGILAAKLAGGLLTLAPTVLLAGLFAATMAWVSGGGVEAWILLTVPTSSFVLFAYLLAAGASLRCATPRGAFGLSMGMVLAILLGLPMGFAALDSLPGMNFRPDQILPFFHPAWFLQEAGSTMRWYWRSWRNLESTLPIGLLYGTASIAVFVWMLARFQRLAGRA